MTSFRKVRDDRFALTTLQNPLCELRAYAELVGGWATYSHDGVVVVRCGHD